MKVWELMGWTRPPGRTRRPEFERSCTMADAQEALARHDDEHRLHEREDLPAHVAMCCGPRPKLIGASGRAR